MVLHDSLFFVFALAERKNEKQQKRKSTAVPEAPLSPTKGCRLS
jgi:hypothetical protein